MINWQQVWDFATRQAPTGVTIGGFVGYIIGYLLFHIANEPCGWQIRRHYPDLSDLTSVQYIREYVGDCVNSFGSTIGGLVGTVDPWMIACIGGLIGLFFVTRRDN
jgi:hypothetical protein